MQSVEKELKNEGKSANKLAAKRDKAIANVARIKAQLENLSFSADEYNSLDEENTDLEASVSELGERVDTLSTQLSARLSFNYKDPVRGFDRSKVKGLVANLVKVGDPKHATALEVVAGGKLFQVVVDEAITGRVFQDESARSIAQCDGRHCWLLAGPLARLHLLLHVRVLALPGRRGGL